MSPDATVTKVLLICRVPALMMRDFSVSQVGMMAGAVQRTGILICWHLRVYIGMYLLTRLEDRVPLPRCCMSSFLHTCPLRSCSAVAGEVRRALLERAG